MGKTKTKKSEEMTSNGANGHAESPRLAVLKTYKMYIGGKFPRTESGRYFTLKGTGGKALANVCQGSRKDFRDSVVVARKALPGWAGRAPFNRAQILYRIAEMLEGRSAQFEEELSLTGPSPEEAAKEVQATVDLLVYYAGWCDKYQQVFGAINPVSSSHFNFSLHEPTGVVSVFAPEENGLLGLVATIAPLIAGGNTVVVLASSQHPLPAITFAEVLNSSDVPGGVVNILTGHRDELLGHFSTHMDVNAMVYAGSNKDHITAIQENATRNVKRIILRKDQDWYGEKTRNPYHILDAQEVKTTWHPVGGSFSGGVGY